MAMTEDEKTKREYDLLLANFQSIGKSQTFYVNTLVAFLSLVWVWELLSGGGEVTVQFLGVSVRGKGFWHVVPLVVTLLSLALIGTINLLQHAWRRLDLLHTEIFGVDGALFFGEFDPHKNVLDYLSYLTVRLKRPVLPVLPVDGMNADLRGRIELLLYPALILWCIYTTSYTIRRIEFSWLMIVAVVACVLVQAVCSLPFMWRKACLFVGVHESADHGMNWDAKPRSRGAASNL